MHISRWVPPDAPKVSIPQTQDDALTSFLVMALITVWGFSLCAAAMLFQPGASAWLAAGMIE